MTPLIALVGSEYEGKGGRIRQARAVTVIAVVLAALPRPALSQEPSGAGPRREVHESLGAAVDPLGLQNGLDVAWRWPLWRSRTPLLSDAHVIAGFADRLSPAYNRLGAFVEIAPLSVFDLRFGLEPVYYFGTFSAMLGFPAYSAPFDDHARDALRASGLARSGWAGRAYVAPTARMKVGRWVARAHAELEWWRAQQPGAPFFYEPTRDTLLDARRDTMVTAEAAALYEVRDEPGRKILAGPMYTMSRVIAAPGNRKRDVGLLALVGLGRRRLGARDPTLFVRVYEYLRDPARRHRVGAQLAISFDLGH